MSIRMKRYSLFFISVLIVGLGITMITATGLGTTAVTSLPYVLSDLMPFSFGTLTMLFNIAWVILQIVILKEKFKKKQYLQFFVGPVLGMAIEFSAVLLSFFEPTLYIVRLLYLMAGCVVLAFGVFLQIKAQVIFNPVEGIVFAFAEVFQKKFGDIKITFDSVLVVLALIVSFIGLGYIAGVREGTLISAVLVGPLTNLFQSLWSNKVESALNH